MSKKLRTLKNIAGAGLDYKEEDKTFKELKVGYKEGLQDYKKLYTEDRLLRDVAREWIERNKEDMEKIDTLKDRPMSEYSYVGIGAVSDFIKHFFNLKEE